MKSASDEEILVRGYFHFLLLKLGYSNKTNNPNDSPKRRMFGLFSCGRSGGTLNSAEQARQQASPTKLKGEGCLRLEAISHAHQLKSTEKGDAMHLPFLLVGATGLKPAAWWSQTTRAINCATPRCIKLYHKCFIFASGQICGQNILLVFFWKG